MPKNALSPSFFLIFALPKLVWGRTRSFCLGLLLGCLELMERFAFWRSMPCNKQAFLV
jgi:hypothetical protein